MSELIAASVGWLTAIAALSVLVLAFGLPLWALRRHQRMFPKGWDRTGWDPEPGKARRFESMFTYFSGGRGS
jgi:hypothetical protein